MSDTKGKVLTLILLVFSVPFLGVFSIGPVHAATQFSFAAAGDYGYLPETKAVWASMGSSGANFALGVGDFLYNPPTSTLNESTWCNTYKASVPNVELIVGNHETWETNSSTVDGGGGSINKFVQDCPFTLSQETGSYGFRYYFDYPSASPLARFIMVDPAIWNGTTGDSFLSYANGTANYNWVSSVIDNARSNGIPWIIVAMHKICIGTGSQGCEVPMSFLTMLMNKRVDLIIQGHDHTYQRSKQLTCATQGTYVSSCVANAGSSLTKGAGTVFVIDGTGGVGGGNIVSNGDTGYFVTYCCTNGAPLGYSLYTITSTSLQSTFVRTGGQLYSGDSFTITGTPPPYFTVTANPTMVSLVSGHNANSKITVTSKNGFTGTVYAKAVASSTNLTATLNPLSFSVPKGGSGATTLTLTSRVFGTYSVNVTITSGSLSVSVLLTVRVTDFKVSANPTSLFFQPKKSATSNITVTSLNGFSGSVGLSATGVPSGLGFSWSKTSVTVPSNGSAFSILKITTDKVGTWNVTVTGSTGGGPTHKVFLTVIVANTPPPDFAITAVPSTLKLNSGSSATTTATVTGNFGFTGTLSISTSVGPSSGLSVSCSPTSVSLSSTTTNASSTCTLQSSSPGSYSVTISASNGTLTRTTIVTAQVMDFSVTISPTTVSGSTSSTSSATVTVSSLAQFTGSVTLTTIPSSANVTASISPSAVSVPSGGSATATLSLSSNVPGSYTVMVIGSAGSLSHNATVAYTVTPLPDFSITSAPASVTTTTGSAGSSTITVTSLNGFNSAVNLAMSISPSSGLACGLNPTSLTPPSGGMSNSTLSCTGTVAGSYTVSVTGTSGSLSHGTTVAYTLNAAPDFTVSASPSSVTIPDNSNGTSTITLAPANGFQGTVSIFSSVTPSNGLACNVTPSSLALNGSQTSMLSCQASITGSYTVTVTGTSGSLSHSTTIAFQVTGTSSASSYALVTSFSGQVYKLYPNGTLTLIGQPVTSALRQIAWKPDGSYALIVGDTAVLLKWNGTALTQIPTSAVMSQGDDLNTVAWKPDGSFALIGGGSGDLLSYDGTTLTRVSNPSARQIQGIGWNPAGTTALLVGNGGTLLSYQNGIVTILNSGTTNDLYGVGWNPNGQYALISGGGGSILRWDGTSVTALNTNGLYASTTIVRYLAWNSAGTQALLVGNAGGLVLSYDGNNLTVLSSGTGNGLYSLAWSDSTTATVVGNGGTMLLYSNGVFNPITSGVTVDLRGIAWKPV